MRLSTLLCALSLTLTPLAALAEGGTALLTVSGQTVSPNRPPATDTDPGFFAYHEVRFEKGYAFDRADLEALTRQTIEAPLPGTETVVSFSGPRVVDVMKMAQAQGQLLTALALDGYAAEITWDELMDHGAILAIDIDGAPMGLGGLGPAMIVFEPVEDDPKLAQILSDKQVWGCFYIRVE